jgi:protein-L-isoaspartate(D-aspartate) O-methyltransferase
LEKKRLRKERELTKQRENIINDLIRSGYLSSEKVIKAMLKVKREDFLLESQKDLAYLDTPLSTGYGQTISAIHMVAIMNEALELEAGHKVLEIGAGSGYHAATIAEIIAPSDQPQKGHIYTIEVIPELAKFAEENLKKGGYERAVTVICADGSRGYPLEAPYDRILATAAAPKVPQPLIDQLKIGGILVAPIGDLYTYQNLVYVKKLADGRLHRKNLGGVVFVPMVGEYGWVK